MNKWEGYKSDDEIRKAIQILFDPGDVFEARIIGTTEKKIISGYFKDAATLIDAFKSIDPRNKNIYVTLGRVKEECFSRSQSERFLVSQQTTSDTEIVGYRWLFVDLDPVRTAGISSNAAELKYAKDLSDKVFDFMKEYGFPDPIRAASGNGYHLLYKIDVLNNKNGNKLIEKCLKVLASLFDTDEVKIDTTNSNPSRICKLYGTLAQKGANTADRPHRMSHILSAPKEIRITDMAVLNRLAAELPDEPEQTYQNRGGVDSRQTFDLLDFLNTHQMSYKEDSNDRAKIFRLDECPFDPSHKNGDAKIFLYGNGAIAFKCHHNHCRQYKWQDVRLKYEPHAYDVDHASDAEIDAGWQQHKATKQATPKPEPPKKKEKRKLKTAAALMKKDLPEPKVFIGVGDDVPLLVEGTCILSAKPKLGKSWLALSMCLAISNGDDFLGYKTQRCSTLYLDLETSEQLQQKRLRKALNGRPVPENFFLDTETDSIENGFVPQIEAYLEECPDIGLVVVDVFQIIRSPSKNAKESEYDHAYRDITPLNELAQKHHISIILVCHDRKAVDPDDPFSNILGSTGLQGAATQMMVMFKKKKDDPIHISVKGKTIDGLPELNVKLDNAQWSIVEGGTSEEREREADWANYRNSDIRKAVVKIIEEQGKWEGRCSALIDRSVECDVSITDSAKSVGGFLNKHRAKFLKEDRIKIDPISNGTGAKTYKIYSFTVDTVDENEWLTVDGWQKVSNDAGLEVPFL